MSEAIREGDLVLTPGEFGRVVGDASGPIVVVDHDGHCATYSFDEVEAVVGVSERDAAIAERDELRAQLEEREADMHARVRAGYDATIADCWRAAIAKVEVERDRLRRELEALREHVDAQARNWERHFGYEAESALHDVSARLDAILRGES